MPGIQSRTEGDSVELGESFTRIQVEASHRDEAGGSEHGGDLRPVDAEEVPARGGGGAAAAGPPLRRVIAAAAAALICLRR